MHAQAAPACAPGAARAAREEAHSRCMACGRGPGRVRGRAFAGCPAVPPGASMAYNTPRAHGLDAQAHCVDAQAHGTDPQAHCVDPQAHGLDPQAHCVDAQAHGADARTHGLAPRAHDLAQAVDAAPRARGDAQQAHPVSPPPAADETQALPAAGAAACIAPNRRVAAGAPHAAPSAPTAPSAALARAVALCGGQSALASAIGVTQSHVWNWLARARTPAEHCPAIERATRRAVRCEELRPDIDWGYLREVVRTQGPEAEREQQAAQATAPEAGVTTRP
jgi:DNA-binding transcriptional regulator YdaS (Cro superfamily)